MLKDVKHTARVALGQQSGRKSRALWGVQLRHAFDRYDQAYDETSRD